MQNVYTGIRDYIDALVDSYGTGFSAKVQTFRLGFAKLIDRSRLA